MVDGESLCKILKIYDGECTGNLILIFSLNMENIVFNFSKLLVVI